MNKVIPRLKENSIHDIKDDLIFHSNELFTSYCKKIYSHERLIDFLKNTFERIQYEFHNPYVLANTYFSSGLYYLACRRKLLLQAISIARSNNDNILNCDIVKEYCNLINSLGKQYYSIEFLIKLIN
jgi:hypothetical protein